MKAHSAAVCQCSSRTPPAVNRMSTPAIDFETCSSRTVTSRDHPPSCMRLCEIPKGYLKVCTPPASVCGGRNESGFCASIAGLPGPGALEFLSPLVGYGGGACLESCLEFWPAAFAADSMPAASAADPTPRNPRRENWSFLESSILASSLFGSKLIGPFLGPLLRNQQHQTSRLRLRAGQNDKAAARWCQSSVGPAVRQHHHGEILWISYGDGLVWGRALLPFRRAQLGCSPPVERVMLAQS